MFRAALPVLAVALLSPLASALAKEWFVAPGGSGDGSAGSPFGTIQAGVSAAQPGDTVTVAAGTYNEAVTSARAGTGSAPITLRAAPGATVLVTRAGNVLRVSHAHVRIEGLTFDAQYGDADAVIVDTAADGFVLRNSEVRRATRDCVDLRAPPNVLIEGCLIHHCLNATGGRTDAHGIVAGGVRDLVIRDTEVHTFSGDAFQVDPGRATQRWDRVTIEGCRFWLEPLPAPENGFPAGTVAGENAVDTKILSGGGGGTLVIRDTEAWGFGSGLISNMAAFNLKETVNATLDRVTVRDSEIAFRLRHPAVVTVRNAVVHDVLTAVRYEDGIVAPKVLNCTFGSGITRAFQQASSSSTQLDVRNLLLLGSSLPTEASGASNLATSAAAFVNAAADDYRLAEGSPAIDTGVTIAEVTTDRLGQARPYGSGYDRGAYEWCPGSCSAVTPDGGQPDGGGGQRDAGQEPSDGGTADASTPGDAGPGPGSSADAGTEDPDGATAGCGCGTGSLAGLAALFLALLWSLSLRRAHLGERASRPRR